MRVSPCPDGASAAVGADCPDGVPYGPLLVPDRARPARRPLHGRAAEPTGAGPAAAEQPDRGGLRRQAAHPRLLPAHRQDAGGRQPGDPPAAGRNGAGLPQQMPQHPGPIGGRQGHQRSAHGRLHLPRLEQQRPRGRSQVGLPVLARPEGNAHRQGRQDPFVLRQSLRTDLRRGRLQDRQEGRGLLDCGGLHEQLRVCGEDGNKSPAVIYGRQPRFYAKSI